MSRIPKPFEVYKHFKGNLYQILNVAEHSETGERLVIYQALYGEYKVYARALDNFVELLDVAKYPHAAQKYRFELVEFCDEAQEQCKAEVQSEVEVHSEGEAQCKVEVQGEVPVQSDIVVSKEMETEEQELNVDPLVLQFLDAETYSEKINLLVAMRHRVTDSMITTMAIACDVEVPEGNLEERYDELKSCLAMREKYECVRVR